MLLSDAFDGTGMGEVVLPEGYGERLQSACRATIGDELRSITFFDTDGDIEQVYLREDLERTADLVGFAELERAGFESQATYRNSQLGDYKGTVRMFENGYLTRVLGTTCGVWVTTDGMSMDRFEELVATVRTLLKEFED